MLQYTLEPRASEFHISHISNRAPPTWFEDCRWEVITRASEFMGESKAFGLVRVASYTYNREMHLGSEVTIKTWVGRLGSSSAVFHHEAWQSGELCVSGEVVLVAIDSKRRVKTEISPEARAYLLELSA